ncbi:MucR family transcriptional regulator [Azospirillum sp. TSO22-1]|uniref:MucR family transcriptional regulator n=1 Tax=Azospirillum sp. TSO22-1 TaxID=716789 RepID=UPI000D6203E4|nr:MucR family transcriptional regulator [Azospirillum sp. TSO22-1]PWC38921.1 MucR family transcriptional regulator [Azospirillum sp. TSO22-1]
MPIEPSELQVLTAKVVAAFVSNNSVPVTDLPALISSVQAAFRGLGEEKAAPQKTEQAPAVPIKKSVTPDYIVCLEDGKKLKMLKRHLKTVYDLTPDEYRVKWALPPEYPMVAPNYAKARSEMATKLGLGRKKVTQD